MNTTAKREREMDEMPDPTLEYSELRAMGAYKVYSQRARETGNHPMPWPKFRQEFEDICAMFAGAIESDD